MISGDNNRNSGCTQFADLSDKAEYSDENDSKDKSSLNQSVDLRQVFVDDYQMRVVHKVRKETDHRCDILDHFEFLNQNRKNSKENGCTEENRIVLLVFHREGKVVG
jgi:hypothetical protein